MGWASRADIAKCTNRYMGRIVYVFLWLNYVGRVG